ncbi:MAG TPA: ribonuclease III family protein [Candidatus Acidoferrum sp.]|nr:ribonuclease III family protein [Candidatus Acidoferrum sp.]
MADSNLAKLGDAYVNFVFSLGRSRALQEPQGIKVSDRILAEALRRSGLRQELPHRTTRQDCANAVEALLVYGYLNKLVSLEETVDQIAAGPEPPVEVFVQLIKTVASKIERGKPDSE